MACRLRQQCARPLKIGGSIDAERYGVNERHVDAHAILHGAQLLEALAEFQCGRRQFHVARQRGAAIRIDADVVIERAIS